MELTLGLKEQLYPRNVALMMFADAPELFFPYTQVEIVEFPDGDASEYFENPPIRGPIDLQIGRTLNFLKDKILKSKIIKQVDREESIHLYSYPYQAIEEILVNCFYHRDYQLREPVEIRIYPHSIVFINQGGPDRSIRLESFNKGEVRSRRYRNRRLGEFLKELKLTEGRATGIPTVLKSLEENGSPAPQFKTDDQRSFFEVELFIHPEFIEEPSILFDVKDVIWDIDVVSDVLNKILSIFISDEAGGVVEYSKVADNQSRSLNELDFSGVVGGEVNKLSILMESAENQSNVIIESLHNDLLSSVVSGVATAEIEGRLISVLIMSQIAKRRNQILAELKLSTSQKNSEAYIKPLVEKGFLTMTIPNKPTSPKQAYITTLKGKLLLKLIKYSK